MSEPTSPDLGPPERLHPLFLLGGLGGSLRQLAGAYALLAYLVVSGSWGTAVTFALVLVILTVVGTFLYWANFRFRVGDNEIRIDSGIVSRTHRSIPFDRIQDVDITQGPLARIAGLARVSFETGGSAGGGADEGSLAAIPLERAEQLRSLIRQRRADTAAAETRGGDEAQAPIYAMDLPRLALAGLFNFSLAIFAGLFGLTQTMGDVLGFDPFDQSFWEGMLSSEGPIGALIAANRAALIAAGVIVLLLAGAATGLVRTTLRDFGFRLERTETSLRRRRGLFTKSDVSLPVRRVQAAVVGTGPVRDPFGWRDLKLQNLARDEGSGDHVVAPLATDQEVDRILAEIGWRGLCGPIAWRRISRAYIWIFVIGISPLLVIFAGQAALLALGPVIAEQPTGNDTETLPAMLVILAALAMLVLARVLAWKRTRYALDGDRLLVRTGWWRRRMRILPVDKIQSIDIAESFLSRWFGVATLMFGVAGGQGFSAHNIPAVPDEEARELRNRLLGSRP